MQSLFSFVPIQSFAICQSFQVILTNQYKYFQFLINSGNSLVVQRLEVDFRLTIIHNYLEIIMNTVLLNLSMLKTWLTPLSMKIGLISYEYIEAVIEKV